MASLVTLADLKLSLYLPAVATTEIDARAALVQKQAEDAIGGYLADTPGGFDPTWTPTTTPARVQRAVMLLAGHFYKNVDGAPAGTEDAAVWAAIAELLRRDRDPVLA